MGLSGKSPKWFCPYLEDLLPSAAYLPEELSYNSWEPLFFPVLVSVEVSPQNMSSVLRGEWRRVLTSALACFCSFTQTALLFHCNGKVSFVSLDVHMGRDPETVPLLFCKRCAAAWERLFCSRGTASGGLVCFVVLQ